MGLIAALFFLVMCGTGGVLAYRPQLEKILNHWGVSSIPPLPGARALPIETIAERVRENTGVIPQAVTVYPGASQPVDVYLGRQGGTVYADAYTGAIIGHPSPAVFSFFGATQSWHEAFGAKGPNRELAAKVMDASNFVCFFVVLSGLYLWFPRKCTWHHVRAVLLLRLRLTGKARDFNWHNVIGIWTLVPMVIMVWSGIALSYPWAGRVTLQALALMPSNQPSVPDSRTMGFVVPNAEPDPFRARLTGLGSLLERAKSRVPGWGSIDFTIPESMAAPVSYTIDPTGCSLIKGGTASRLQLARSGEELGFQGPNPVRGRGIYRFAHTGELWGVWGQTVAMLGCLGGVFLVWTGVSLSLRRFGSWRARRIEAPVGM